MIKALKQIPVALVKAALILLIALLVLLINSSRAAERSNTRTTITFKQEKNNEISFRIYTNISGTLHFYLFSTEGKQVKHLETMNELEKQIKNPGPGTYIYQCFENDTQLKNGILKIIENNLIYE
ncbi:MAG: hypothetical protein ABIT96_09830 [Ferruginibacter sp.]